MCLSHVQVPTKSRRKDHISWRGRYRQFWTPWCECWEPNLDLLESSGRAANISNHWPISSASIFLKSVHVGRPEADSGCLPQTLCIYGGSFCWNRSSPVPTCPGTSRLCHLRTGRQVGHHAWLAFSTGSQNLSSNLICWSSPGLILFVSSIVKLPLQHSSIIMWSRLALNSHLNLPGL